MMLTIVWDVDDVLNDLMYQWFTGGWMVEHPSCAVTYEELSENPPHAALQVQIADYFASMDAFRKTERALEMKPNAEVLAWFHAHGGRFRHIALTARPLETAPDVAHWVMRHFGAWIRCFGVVPTRAPQDVPVYDRNKGEYLDWLGRGDVLVDDSLENIRHAQLLGMKILTYPQPWNRGKHRSNSTAAALLQRLTDMAGTS